MAKVICIMGPTASGKTALACELYDRLDAELISVDSSLVYRDMDIGSAKPSPQELEQYPHHLINILDATQSFSASEFKEQAETLCDDIIHRGKTPILVGGTMLYFKALQQGLDDMPSSDEAIRQKLLKRVEAEGLLALHQELERVDKVASKRIHPNDTQRILRALEVFYITNQPISAFWEKSAHSQGRFQFINIALLPSDREQLHQMIEQRFDAMLEAGFIDEVKALIQKGITSSYASQRAVGYRQAHQYLEGKIDYQTMREKGIVASRQLAKRQLTWLRHYPDVKTFTPFSDGLAEKVMTYLQKF